MTISNTNLVERGCVTTTSGPDYWSAGDIAARTKLPLEFIHQMISKHVIESRVIDGQVMIPRHAALACGTNSNLLVEYKHYKLAQGPAPAPEALDDGWVIPEVAIELLHVLHPKIRGRYIDVELLYAEMESGAVVSRFDEAPGQGVRKVNLKALRKQLGVGGLMKKLRDAQVKRDDQAAEARFHTETEDELQERLMQEDRDRITNRLAQIEAINEAKFAAKRRS